MTDSEEERRRIAGRLRARRAALDWGCDDLARALGADPEEWALLEATGDLSALQLQRAARLLNLPLFQVDIEVGRVRRTLRGERKRAADAFCEKRSRVLRKSVRR